MKIKLWFTVALSVMMLFNICGQAYAAGAVASVAGLVPSQGFFNTARSFVTPVLIRAGSVSRFAVGAFTPASIAVMAGAIGHQIYTEDPASFPALKSFLASMGIGVVNGSLTLTSEVITPAAGSALETCMNLIHQNPAYGNPTIAIEFLKSAAELDILEKIMGFGGTQVRCAGNPSGNLSQGCSAAGVNIGGHYSSNIYTYGTQGDCKYAGVSKITWLYISGTLAPSQYSTIPWMTTIGTENIANRLYDALAYGSGEALTKAQDAAKDIMAWWNRALVTHNPALAKAGSPTRPIGDILQEVGLSAVPATDKDPIVTEANTPKDPAQQTTTTKDTNENVQVTVNEATTTTTNTTNNSGGDDEEPPEDIPDMPQLPSDTDDNAAILGTTGNAAEIETEQGKMAAIMAPLKAIYQTLNASVMASVASILPSGGGGLCSIPLGVYGGSIDFCSVDYSGIRALVIAVAAIFSLILVMS